MLKTTVSLIQFFRVPTTYVLVESKKNISLLCTLNVRPVTYTLFQVLKKNVIENIVPIVVALKNLVNIFLYIFISL